MKRTYYATKWCLSQGVFKVQGTLDEEGKYVHVAQESTTIPMLLRFNRDAFENSVDAYKKALQVAKGHEASLLKALTRARELQKQWKEQT